jgi:hypothetical protein
MRFRQLRIAWTVLCGIACVLLIALWVRSYWRADDLVITMTKTYQFEIQSVPGRCIGFVANAPSRPINGFARYVSAPPEGAQNTFERRGILGGDWPMQTAKWRFTVRTLLIATTLIAAVLGLIVCLTK